MLAQHGVQLLAGAGQDAAESAAPRVHDQEPCTDGGVGAAPVRARAEEGVGAGVAHGHLPWRNPRVHTAAPQPPLLLRMPCSATKLAHHSQIRS